MWTHFHDMYSGGDTKEKWEHIFIEAPIDEAIIIFYNIFGHNPERVTCTCCGPDYSLIESSTLEQATGHERGCHYDREKGIYLERKSESKLSLYTVYIRLIDYVEMFDVKVIRKHEIKDEDRIGEVPQEGYVWV